MSVDATANYFYKCGSITALEKLGLAPTLEGQQYMQALADQFRAQKLRGGKDRVFVNLDKLSPAQREALAPFLYRNQQHRERPPIDPQAAIHDYTDMLSPRRLERAPVDPYLAKQGASLERPEDQTFQVHREVDTPATNGPDGRPADEVDYTPGSTQDMWNEHDRRVQLGILPTIDSRTGL